MSSLIFDGVKIDEEKSQKMYLKILQAEYSNASLQYDDKKMVDRLIKIIEEEIDGY